MINASSIARGPLVDLYRSGPARVSRVNGWEVVAEFDGMTDELARARSHVALTDLSHLGKFQMIGRRVGAFCSQVMPDAKRNEGDSAQPGRCWMTARSDRSPSTTHHRILWARQSGDLLVVLSLVPTDSVAPSTLIPHGGEPASNGIHWLDVTGQLAIFELIGPDGEDLLRRFTSLDVSVDAFGAGRCAQSGLARIPVSLIRPPADYRTSGDNCFQLWCDRSYGQYLWESLLDAARALGGGPLGWAAWQNSF